MKRVTLVGNLVTDLNLQTSKDGKKSYLRFTLATNSSIKQEDNTYKQTGSFYWYITVFGKTAELLAKSSIPKGTPLLVDGRLGEVDRPAYTSKEGIEYPDRVELAVSADNVAVVLSEYNSKPVNVLLNKEDSKPQPAKAEEPTTKQAQQPKKPAEQPKADSLFDDEEDDIFGTSNESTTDDFDDLFN